MRGLISPAVVGFAAIWLLGPTVTAQAGPTKAQQCAVSKLKETGKYERCRLNAEAKGVKKNAAPDFTKCDVKFGEKWTKAENKFGAECPTAGDAAAIQAFSSGHTDDVVSLLNPTERIVFVTSQLVLGKLGGLTGADAECQAAADSAGLLGAYLAWLSTSTVGPADRFVQSTVPYVRTDGAIVALDWADLTSGSIRAAINVDEFANTISGHPTWTNTDVDGTPLNNVGDPTLDSCDEWTSFGGQAGNGFTTAVDGGWTIGSQTNFSCASAFQLYCFQL